jgi:hypothetical protein
VFDWTGILLVVAIVGICWLALDYVFVCSYASTYSSNRNFGSPTRSLSSSRRSIDLFCIGSRFGLYRTYFF